MHTFNILKNSFEKFYSSEMKVIVSALDRGTIKKLALPGALQVYELNLTGENDGLISPFNTENHGDRVPLTTPPQFCIALLALSRQSQNELNLLKGWWSGAGFLEDLELIYFEEEKINLLEINKVFVNYLIDKWRNTAARSTTLQRQLTSLRIAHEELQNTFARYEDFLSHARIPPVQLRFISEPTDKVAITDDPHENPLRFVQRLPFSSRGLAIIEIHANLQDQKAEGVLSASVKILENLQELASWQIPYRAIRSGWVRLVLPNIWSGPKLTAEFYLTCETLKGKAPTLSLTAPQLLPEACLKRDDGTRLDRSLALRLWTGFPGIQQFSGSYDNYIYELSSEIQFGNKGNAEYFFREGWAVQESRGTWSVGKHARMTLMLSKPVDTDLCLIAKVKGLVAPENGYTCECYVYVNNQKIESWHFNEDKISEETAIINATFLKDAPIVDISFEILDPKSPKELGKGQDARRLGIHLESIRLEPVLKDSPQAHYAPGNEIRFKLDGNAPAYLGKGWGNPEENGTWTVMKQAYLSLVMPTESKGPLYLIAKAKGYILPKIGHTCRCHVQVNNQEIDIWHFKNNRVCKQTAVIDTACLQSDSAINISFEFPDLKSPMELGQGQDERKLGMYVQSIWIRPG